jgi:hypothetical protein
MGKYMSNIKRLSLALVALGLSAPAFADSTVLVPSQHGGFKVGIDALYLRPTSSGLDYATSLTFPTGFVSPGGFERNATVDPSYDWGVYAQIGYLFPCTGNDLTLSYTYLSNDNSDSIVAPTPISAVTTGSAGIAILPLSVLSGVEYGAAAGKAQFTLNVVDLDGGQRFTTGSYDMRMFAGLRYANIDTTVKTFGSPFPVGVGGGVNTTSTGYQEFKSQFRGLGPRIGVDARYCLSSGFGVDADLSTALLAGRTDSHYYATTVTTTTPVNTLEVKNGSNNRLIPVLEAKLGVDYTYIMDCRCKSSLVFEVGYQTTNYFNAADHHVRVIDPITTTTTGPTVADGGSTSDVGFDGPYLGVKYYA